MHYMFFLTKVKKNLESKQPTLIKEIKDVYSIVIKSNNKKNDIRLMYNVSSEFLTQLNDFKYNIQKLNVDNETKKTFNLCYQFFQNFFTSDIYDLFDNKEELISNITQLNLIIKLVRIEEGINENNLQDILSNINELLEQINTNAKLSLEFKKFFHTTLSHLRNALERYLYGDIEYLQDNIEVIYYELYQKTQKFQLAQTKTQDEISTWEKIKNIFLSTQKNIKTIDGTIKSSESLISKGSEIIDTIPII